MKQFHQELEHIDIVKGGWVLDVGCGEGQLLEKFSRKGFSVLGIEKDSETSFLPSVVDNIVIMDMYDWFQMNKGKEKFDFIIFSFSLMFVPKRKRNKIIKQAKLSLNENGLMYIGVFNEDEQSKWSIPETEYLKWLKGMRAEYIERKTVDDAPHKGRLEPHSHCVTHVLLRKVGRSN